MCTVIAVWAGQVKSRSPGEVVSWSQEKVIDAQSGVKHASSALTNFFDKQFLKVHQTPKYFFAKITLCTCPKSIAPFFYEIPLSLDFFIRCKSYEI